VNGERKAAAVASALNGPITEACPASALRRHPSATLFLDPGAASLL
jgi:glucosamine-6-phosphate deaminase